MEVSNSSTILNEEIEPQSQNIENEINALDEKKDNEIKSSTSNGLENFDFNEEEAPELFNSENTEDSFSSLDTENNKEEEDELEIPAFLRRQKN
jgi:cell division protein FtsZ